MNDGIKEQSTTAVISEPKIGSDFEKKLFEKGTLVFNLEELTAKAKIDLKESADWYKNVNWDKNRAEAGQADRFEYAKHEMFWRNCFSGQIPKHWDLWSNVMNDFKQAKDLGVQLSETLVDAGVSYPHHLVANEVGKTQKLNIRQLVWLFVRPNMPNWNMDQILTAQREMGLSENDIQEARKTANEVRRQAKKKASGSYSFSDDSKLLQKKR